MEKNHDRRGEEGDGTTLLPREAVAGLAAAEGLLLAAATPAGFLHLFAPPDREEGEGQGQGQGQWRQAAPAVDVFATLPPRPEGRQEEEEEEEEEESSRRRWIRALCVSSTAEHRNESGFPTITIALAISTSRGSRIEDSGENQQEEGELEVVFGDIDVESYSLALSNRILVSKSPNNSCQLSLSASGSWLSVCLPNDRSVSIFYLGGGNHAFTSETEGVALLFTFAARRILWGQEEEFTSALLIGGEKLRNNLVTHVRLTPPSPSPPLSDSNFDDTKEGDEPLENNPLRHVVHSTWYFPCDVSAADICQGLAAFGTVDGRVYVWDLKAGGGLGIEAACSHKGPVSQICLYGRDGVVSVAQEEQEGGKGGKEHSIHYYKMATPGNLQLSSVMRRTMSTRIITLNLLGCGLMVESKEGDGSPINVLEVATSEIILAFRSALGGLDCTTHLMCASIAGCLALAVSGAGGTATSAASSGGIQLYFVEKALQRLALQSAVGVALSSPTANPEPSLSAQVDDSATVSPCDKITRQFSTSSFQSSVSRCTWNGTSRLEANPHLIGGNTSTSKSCLASIWQMCHSKQDARQKRMQKHHQKLLRNIK